MAFNKVRFTAIYSALLMAQCFAPVQANCQFIDRRDLYQQQVAITAAYNSILKELTPGRILDRYHAEKNGVEIKLEIDRLNIALKNFKADIEKNISTERKSAPKIDAKELANQRAIAIFFNQTLSRLQNTQVVFDQDSFMGGFASSEQPFAQGVAPVVLTSFDYTRGFKVECRSDHKSGLQVHRNRLTGLITWHSNYKSGVAISGENARGEPIIQSEYKVGLNSVYDYRLKKWVTAKGSYKTPVGIVYNPRIQSTETHMGENKTGIAGVYNPLTQEVEWKSEYKAGVAGYFDYSEKKVIWKIENKSGVACIWRDPNGVFFTSAGFGSDYGDDEDSSSKKKKYY